MGNNAPAAAAAAARQQHQQQQQPRARTLSERANAKPQPQQQQPQQAAAIQGNSFRERDEDFERLREHIAMDEHLLAEVDAFSAEVGEAAGTDALVKNLRLELSSEGLPGWNKRLLGQMLAHAKKSNAKKGQSARVERWTVPGSERKRWNKNKSKKNKAGTATGLPEVIPRGKKSPPKGGLKSSETLPETGARAPQRWAAPWQQRKAAADGAGEPKGKGRAQGKMKKKAPNENNNRAKTSEGAPQAPKKRPNKKKSQQPADHA